MKNALKKSFHFFRRVIDQHNVNALFCVPTALRIIRRADPDLSLSRKYSVKSYVFLHANGIDTISHDLYILYIYKKFYQNTR